MSGAYLHMYGKYKTFLAIKSKAFWHSQQKSADHESRDLADCVCPSPWSLHGLIRAVLKCTKENKKYLVKKIYTVPQRSICLWQLLPQCSLSNNSKRACNNKWDCQSFHCVTQTLAYSRFDTHILYYCCTTTIIIWKVCKKYCTVALERYKSLLKYEMYHIITTFPSVWVMKQCSSYSHHTVIARLSVFVPSSKLGW